MAHTIATGWGIGAHIFLPLLRGRRAHSRAMFPCDVTNRQNVEPAPSILRFSLPKIYHRWMVPIVKKLLWGICDK